MSTLICRPLADASWLFDRDLEAADNAALAAYDLRDEIERAVTHDDLFEECALRFTDVQGDSLMRAIERGEDRDLHLMHALFLQMKEEIVKRRLQGE